MRAMYNEYDELSFSPYSFTTRYASIIVSVVQEGNGFRSPTYSEGVAFWPMRKVEILFADDIVHAMSPHVAFFIRDVRDVLYFNCRFPILGDSCIKQVYSS